MKLFVTNLRNIFEFTKLWTSSIAHCFACLILQFSCLDPSPTTASIKQNKNERFPHTFASRALTVNLKVYEPNWHGKQIVQHYNPAAPMTIVVLAGPAKARICCYELWAMLFCGNVWLSWPWAAVDFLHRKARRLACLCLGGNLLAENASNCSMLVCACRCLFCWNLYDIHDCVELCKGVHQHSIKPTWQIDPMARPVARILQQVGPIT